MQVVIWTSCFPLGAKPLAGWSSHLQSTEEVMKKRKDLHAKNIVDGNDWGRFLRTQRQSADEVLKLQQSLQCDMEFQGRHQCLKSSCSYMFIFSAVIGFSIGFSIISSIGFSDIFTANPFDIFWGTSIHCSFAGDLNWFGGSGVRSRECYDSRLRLSLSSPCCAA